MQRGSVSSTRKSAPSPYRGRERSRSLNRSLKVERFLGLSLSGAKSDKTFVSVLEYYPNQQKLFLSHVHDRLETHLDISADTQLYQIIDQGYSQVQRIAIDVPLTLPLCMTCKLRCPGYETCQEPHIRWLWSAYEQISAKKARERLFAPYTERCGEIFWGYLGEERFSVEPALGSNLAPLTARAHFLKRRLKAKMIETIPEIVLARLGEGWGCRKSDLKFYRTSSHGQGSRGRILKEVSEQGPIFIYQQDMMKLVEHPNAFDSWLCSLAAFCDYKKNVEPRPKGFPRQEAWPSVPKSTKIVL